MDANPHVLIKILYPDLPPSLVLAQLVEHGIVVFLNIPVVVGSNPADEIFFV